MGKIQRAFAFARHIPPRKLARRLELDFRRCVRDRAGFKVQNAAPSPALAAFPPLPVFAPRGGLMRQENGQRIFRFIGREFAMRGDAINWLAPGTGAANQLWRMNLHYMEYLETADDGAFARLVTDWIDSNPADRSGTWRDSWNSYALSLRVIVWMQQLARRRTTLPEGLTVQMRASLATQLRFLAANLETDLGGNHLIKNIKALIWASAYFTGDEAERWRALGLKLLANELDHQILQDGFHDERSPSYHAQVFSDLLECRHALGSDVTGGALDGALSRMAQALADMTHPDGGPALFNDAGLSMAYAPGECLRTYTEVTGETAQARRLFAFPQAGYFGLRSGGTYVVADCGRIAPDDLPAHGHGDVLSFEWSVGLKRIIVDQGVFEYVAGDKRAKARAASSHNTLCPDGADQAEFFGAFRCGRRPNVTVRKWQPRDDGFILEGSHDGFANLPGRPIHVRQFQATPKGIMIADRIEGSTGRPSRISFLLHPEVQLDIDGNSAHLSSGPARIRLTASAPIRSEAAVWWPDMGVEIATLRLIIDMPQDAREIQTHFALSPT